ncbi:MAG: putative metal-dependent hydrolase [Mangrovimonas sp.]|nr:putative metal-dependent hydrolase [Mangrovimonas sp.]MCB0471173.1 putative metal-dependent hydrolase [Flavobacteriaceae bacterium]
MTEQELEHLRYPIGKFSMPKEITKALRDEWIVVLETFPDRLEQLVANITETKLETPYRPGGWTVRQVIHHVADSHHHSYARFKWALAENKPLIKAYEEKDWAELKDVKHAPIAISLLHIRALHGKLVHLLKCMSDTDFERSFMHPETGREVFLNENLGMYAWHCNHHYAHIESVVVK